MTKRRGSWDSNEERKEKKKSHKKDEILKENQITMENYYEKAQEFRVWLKLKKGIYYDDLLTNKLKKYFKKFIIKWNNNQLNSMYYTKIPENILKKINRTKYKWNFKELNIKDKLIPKLTESEKIIEKKNSIVHGPSLQKEDEKDGCDTFLMGGSNDYHGRVQKRKQTLDRRQEELQGKVSAAQEAEAAKMQKFLNDMGIQPGQEHSTIAPREK